MTSSTLLLLKNQNAPVSLVIGIAMPWPDMLCDGTFQLTRTENLEAFRQRASAPAVQVVFADVSSSPAGLSQDPTGISTSPRASAEFRPLVPENAAVSATLATRPCGLT